VLLVAAIGAGAWLAVAAVFLATCRMAAQGDRQQAREPAETISVRAIAGRRVAVAPSARARARASSASDLAAVETQQRRETEPRPRPLTGRAAR
jgi:hypothetical protein